MASINHPRRSVLVAAVVVALLAISEGFTRAATVSAATPQNGRIVYTRLPPDDIYSIASDGTRRDRLTDSGALDYSPSWSSDGAQIAFERQRLGRRGDMLMVMQADGSDSASILKIRPSILDPDWFPDGAHIAFCRAGRTKRVFVVGSDGSGPTPIGPMGSCEPAVSPDGSKIAFVWPDKRDADLWLMNADGSGLTQLTSHAHGHSPTWSPDGSQIAFYREVATQVTDLFVINADGSSQTQITDTRRNEYSPCWSPDGTLILFERTNYWDPYSSTDLWTVAPDGSNPAALTGTNGVWESSPDWQPV